MIRVLEYRYRNKETVSDKEMTPQDALFDLVSHLHEDAEVIFWGFGAFIQLDGFDKEGDKICVSYGSSNEDADFVLLERMAKYFVLATHQCHPDVREELRGEFRELAEKFLRI